MNQLLVITVVLLLIVVVLASKLQSQGRSKANVRPESCSDTASSVASDRLRQSLLREMETDGNEQASDEPDKVKYARIGAMFSPAERSFLGVLDQAVGEGFRVFGKVRIADVVAVDPKLPAGNRQSAQNRINAKHFDFVLCSKDDLSVAGVIELNDQSHQRDKAKKRDGFVTDLCQSIGLPLLQIPAHREYSVSDLRKRLLEEVGQQEQISKLERADSPSLPDQPVTYEHEEQLWEALQNDSDATQQAETVAEERPRCPKCSAPMVRRAARSGKHAGQEFWGCSTYPKCRGVLGLDATSS